MHQAKLWASEVFELAKMKGNSQQTPLFNTTELCSHSQPSQDWPSFQTTRADHHCASEKQTAKADHSSVACFEYEF